MPWPYLQLLTEQVVQGRLWTKSTWVQCFRLVAGLGRSIRFVDLSWSVWSASPIHCTFLATSSKTELVRVGWARPQTGRQCLEQGFLSLCPAHLSTRLEEQWNKNRRKSGNSGHFQGVCQWYEEHHASQPVFAGCQTTCAHSFTTSEDLNLTIIL